MNKTYKYTKPVYMRILNDKGLTLRRIGELIGVSGSHVGLSLKKDEVRAAFEEICKQYFLANYKEKETSVKAVSKTVPKQIESSNEPVTFLVVVAKSKEAFVRKVINSVGGICE